MSGGSAGPLPVTGRAACRGPAWLIITRTILFRHPYSDGGHDRSAFSPGLPGRHSLWHRVRKAGNPDPHHKKRWSDDCSPLTFSLPTSPAGPAPRRLL